MRPLYLLFCPKVLNFAGQMRQMQKKIFSPTSRDILRIALPSIVSNVTVPLLGLVDIMIVGHMGSSAYIGAIAVGSMMFNVVYWVFGFLRMATSGLTAQALGRRSLDEMGAQLLRALSIGLGVGLLFIILQWPIGRLAIALMEPPADVSPMVKVYFSICIYGAPAVLGLYGLSGWFIGMGDTRTPMLISIVQNIVNILLSLCFVFLLGMKVEGVALGTLLAQWAGLLMGLGAIRRKHKALSRGSIRKVLGDGAAMRRFFRVGGDIFLRTLFLVSVNMYFTAAGARQGSMILAANTLLFQLFTLYSYVMDGFAYAGEALAGRHYGAGDFFQLRHVVRCLFLWGLILTIAYTLLYILGGTPFLRLLTSDYDVVVAAKAFLPWAAAIPVAGLAAFLWDGVFIGLTATRGMLLSCVVGAAAFFALFFGLFPSMGNHALWLALLAYLALRGIVETFLFRRYIPHPTPEP